MAKACMIVDFPAYHFIGSFPDCSTTMFVEQTQISIYQCGRFFYQAQGANHFAR